MDSPETTSGITRITGPFCVEATNPTPADLEIDGAEDSDDVAEFARIQPLEAELLQVQLRNS